MSRGVQWSLLGSAVVAALIALAGCSHYLYGEREAWRRRSRSRLPQFRRRARKPGTRTHLSDRWPRYLWCGLSATGVGPRRERAAWLRRRAVASTRRDPRRRAAARDGRWSSRTHCRRRRRPSNRNTVQPQYGPPPSGPPPYGSPQYASAPPPQYGMQIPPAQTGAPMSLYPPGVAPPEEDDLDFQPSPPRPYGNVPPRRAPAAPPVTTYSSQSYPPPNYPPQNYPAPDYSQRAEPLPPGVEEHVPLGPPSRRW